MKRKALIILLASMLLLLSACTTTLKVAFLQNEPTILLTVLVGESTSDPGVGDMIREKIEIAYPDVTLEWESVDWGEGFSDLLNAKIASGETPDIIIGKAQDVNAFQSTGALGVFPEDIRNLLTNEGTDATTVDGKLYGITYNQLYQGVLYNKNIFYRYNLTVPETLEELEAIITRLQSVGVTPFATHFQETWYAGNILMQFAIGEVFSRTPNWGDLLRDEEVSFSDSAYRDCVEQVLYQYENTWDDALTITQSESDRRFANEEAAMYVSGTWSIQTLQSVAPYRKIGIFPYPTKDGNAKLISEPNFTFMKSATSEHNDLIDDIYRSILANAEFAQTMCAFTETNTTLSGVEVDSMAMIREDIDAYHSQNRIISASVGNSQLIWAFQYDCAQMIADYLQGKTELDSLLHSWDALRQESKIE